MKNKNKIVIAWIVLFLLFIIMIALSYIKFFGFYTYKDIEIIEEENSGDEAIEIALNSIVDNFNSSDDIEAFKTQEIDIKAVLKNHSIFIYYSDDITTTYEFNYNNLILSINIEEKEDNLDKFNKIYRILIKSIQKRIYNENNIDDLIDLHINDDIELVGIEKINNQGFISYKIDITKKIMRKEGD